MTTMRIRSATLVLSMATALSAACDTTVTNPGPVQEKFLEDTAAQFALVNGAGRALGQAINWVGYTGAAVAREIHPAGSTGSFGISNTWQRGELRSTDRDLNEHWNQAQRARWLAEDAAARIAEQGESRRGLLAQVYLYAGYANRLLGENMCEAVINAGPREDYKVFLTRAEDFFTRAANDANASATVRTAAIAGRASVRVGLAKYAEAAADAASVTDIRFNYSLPYYDLGEDAQRNRIYYSVANRPYRAHTQWGTKYEAYYNETRDPRVPFTTTTLRGDAAIECCATVPFYPQAKYTASSSPIRLSSGREMRLIQAEARLRQSDVIGAMTFINAVRAEASLPALTATTLAEAWTILKRERGIELWLEARRLGDLRRWQTEGTPGSLHPLELPSGDIRVGSHLVTQDLCFPIPPSEHETNPNLRQ